MKRRLYGAGSGAVALWAIALAAGGFTNRTISFVLFGAGALWFLLVLGGVIPLEREGTLAEMLHIHSAVESQKIRQSEDRARELLAAAVVMHPGPLGGYRIEISEVGWGWEAVDVASEDEACREALSDLARHLRELPGR